MTSLKKPLILCILDGWGHRLEKSNNGIALANTPCWNSLLQTYPNTLLEASGPAVGLSEGQIGNSEVGHLTIGSGRILNQDLPRINQAIENGKLQNNQTLLQFKETLLNLKAPCHLMGLLSDGGVHSHIDHIKALSEDLSKAGIPVFVHIWLDGRDTPPNSAEKYIKEFESFIAPLKNVSIATISGRYYAMDRDNRWDRIRLAYLAMAEGKGPQASSALEALHQNYENGLSDEFVVPTVIAPYQGIAPQAGLLCANFRADRMRQIATALVDPAFQVFERERPLKFSTLLGMCEYSTPLTQFFDILFPPHFPENTLGEVISQAGLTQLRLAETEKYAHVTFFFNGGRERPFAGEDRHLIPSPPVATYDLKPEMSAFPLTDALIEAIENGQYDFIVVNYANADMVGHSGDLDATINAIETIDQCLAKIVKVVEEKGAILLITADHGNAEVMKDEKTGIIHTAHTLNPVPFLLVKPTDLREGLEGQGGLFDIAPTVLNLLNLEIPEEMTGTSLMKNMSSAFQDVSYVRTF